MGRHRHCGVFLRRADHAAVRGSAGGGGAVRFVVSARDGVFLPVARLDERFAGDFSRDGGRARDARFDAAADGRAGGVRVRACAAVRHSGDCVRVCARLGGDDCVRVSDVRETDSGASGARGRFRKSVILIRIIPPVFVSDGIACI